VFIVTQSFQVSQALQDLILADLMVHAPTPILDINSILKLYQAGPTPTFNTVLAAFTESSFHGYAGVVLAAFVGPVNLPGGQGIYTDAGYMQTVGVSTAQSAIGCYLVDTTGLIYYGAEQFVTPAPFNVPGDDLDYRFVLAPRSLWGGQNQG
jgi:hypothetical protein